MMSKHEFEKFNNEKTNEKAIEDERRANRISDNEAKKRIAEISGCTNATDFQNLTSSEKKTYVRKFKEAGMSIRQISRLSGVSKGIIERA